MDNLIDECKKLKKEEKNGKKESTIDSLKLIIDCLATSYVIPNYEDELDDEQGNMLAIKLEHSCDEEVKQVARKKKAI